MSDRTACIGIDCGRVHGGVTIIGESTVLDRGALAWALYSVSWDSPDRLTEALAHIQSVVSRGPQKGDALRWFAESAFVPGQAGAYRGAGLEQARALGRWDHVAATLGCTLETVPASQWRAVWGMPAWTKASTASRISRLWWRVLTGNPAGKGDHLSDSLLIAGAHTPGFVASARALAQRALETGNKDAGKLAEAMQALAREALSRRGRPRASKADKDNTQPSKPRRSGWTDKDVADYLKKLKEKETR